MLSDGLNDAIESLHGAMRGEPERLNADFEQALQHLENFDSEETVTALMLTLDDKYDFQDLMWELLHFIERLPDRSFYAGFFNAITKLHYCSPGWAEQILIRCLNSPSSRIRLAQAAAHSSLGSKKTLRIIASKLRDEDPFLFEESTEVLLRQLHV